jgi:hypothetical protein
MMRTDPRYTRVRALLEAKEVPRNSDGRIELCHHCQRAVYFAGGLLPLLIRDVERRIVDIWIADGKKRAPLPIIAPLETASMTAIRVAFQSGLLSRDDARRRMREAMRKELNKMNSGHKSAAKDHRRIDNEATSRH